MSYPSIDFTPKINQLKCQIQNAIVGVFQQLGAGALTPSNHENYHPETKICLWYEGKLLELKHIAYCELEYTPMVSIVLDGQIVKGYKQLTIEELETVYKVVFSFIK